MVGEIVIDSKNIVCYYMFTDKVLANMEKVMEGKKTRGASKRLKMAMLDKGISQVQFAEMIGKPTQSFYNMMNRNTMTFKTVEEFADALGCDVVLRDRETGKEY